MNLPYTFDPLFDLLEKIDVTPDDLVSRKILSKNTVEKIVTGQQVMLATAAKLCLSLGCELSDIVALNFEYDPTEKVDDGTQNYKPWTQAEEERLIDEYRNDFPIAVIASNMNRAPGAIASRAARLIAAGRLAKREPKKKR